MPARAGAGVRRRIVGERLLGEKAVAGRRAPYRLGHIWHDAGRLAGFDVLYLEIAVIGDGIDLLDTEDLIPTFADPDSFWGFPNGLNSESLWRTEEVHHGFSDRFARGFWER
jgi:hypothetical protein